MSPATPKVAFVFTRGRRSRLAGGDEIASELFYGYRELEQRGWRLDLLEETDLSEGQRTLPVRALARLVPRPMTMNLVRVSMLVGSRALARLNSADIVFATNQQQGLELSVLRLAGLLKPPLVMLVMGLLPLEPAGGARAAALSVLLRRTTVAAISRGELAYLRRRLDTGLDLRYLPFGVDHKFWTPGPGEAGEYALSVGNDSNRDFALLMKVWRSGWPPLRVISRLSIPPSRGRIEVIRGDYRYDPMSDAQMRAHVRGALFSVIPVRETAQPSGQSSALQSMACGVPLVLSNMIGLWDRDVMRDGDSCLLVPPGDEAAMTRAVERMLVSDGLRKQIGAAGRAAVERAFTADIMGTELERLFRALEPRGRRRGLDSDALAS